MKNSFYTSAYLLLSLFFLPFAVAGIFFKLLGELLVLPLMTVVQDFTREHPKKRKPRVRKVKK